MVGKTREEERTSEETGIGTETEIEMKKGMANSPGQNPCDLSMCCLLLTPSMMARPSEGSGSSFPALPWLWSQALDI